MEKNKLNHAHPKLMEAGYIEDNKKNDATVTL
jgi:hypothetical protein